MTLTREVKIKPNYETIAWKWMRYSGILLIPLAWVHVLIQDVLVGVHHVALDYVALRWSFVGWRVYDFFLLAFAFAHGMNGLRQILFDFVQGERARKGLSWFLLFFWLALSVVGVVAIIDGVREP